MCCVFVGDYSVGAWDVFFPGSAVCACKPFFPHPWNQNKTCQCFHGASFLVISSPRCSNNEVLFCFALLGGFGSSDAGVCRELFRNWNGGVAHTAYWKDWNYADRDSRIYTRGHWAFFFLRINIFEQKSPLIISREASANLIYPSFLPTVLASQLTIPRTVLQLCALSGRLRNSIHFRLRE